MKLYLDNGYLNFDAIMNHPATFIFMVGARATGKTYGSLLWELQNPGHKFILMRRTQTQLDMINKPDFSPFKPVNEDYGYTVISKPVNKYNIGFYNGTEADDGSIVPTGAPIGYSMALSTMSNVRGFDASDIQHLIYDEFIPEKHERPIREEGKAFLNAYETINRNRELKGKPPLKCICMANANDLGNPIYIELGLVSVAERMQRKQQETYYNPERGILMINIFNSIISRQKRETALYKAAQSSDYAGMALANAFEEISNESVSSRPLVEFKPVVVIGELCIYRHKSDGTFYASMHVTGEPPRYLMSETDRARFFRKYSHLWEAYMRNRVVFENSTCEVLFNKAFA